jgi:hypothetical protein
MVDARGVTALVVAALLMAAGTLGTGLLPSGTAYQTLAGTAIVLGFGLGFYALGAFDRPEE